MLLKIPWSFKDDNGYLNKLVTAEYCLLKIHIIHKYLSTHVRGTFSLIVANKLVLEDLKLSKILGERAEVRWPVQSCKTPEMRAYL